MKNNIASLLLSVFLVNFAHAQFVDLNFQGQKYSENFIVVNSGTTYANIPLPKGEWTAVRGNERTTSGPRGAKMRELILSDIANSQLNMSIFVTVRVNSSRFQWSDEPCKGSDFIYKNDFGTTLFDQRCLTIKLDTYLQNVNSDVQQISRDFYVKNGLKIQYITLQVTMTQFTSSGKFLKVQFYIFPGNYGFENPTTSVIVTHPWYVSNYINDPEKVKFIQQLATWANNYSDILYNGFQEEKQQKAEVKPFAYLQ